MVKDCDPCHGGVRMPHTPGFKEGGHAINAAFEAKIKCWRCHDPQVCAQGCHTSFGADGASAHGSTAKWKAEHRRRRWDAGCGCHSSAAGQPRDFTICYPLPRPGDEELLPAKP